MSPTRSPPELPEPSRTETPAGKRKAEDRGEEDLAAQEAEVVHQPAPEEQGSADAEMAIRLVETVDASYHEAAYEEPEDFGGDEPPQLSAEELAELDDQAELEELTRLKGTRAPEHRVREDVEEGPQWLVSKGTAGGTAIPVGLRHVARSALRA